MAGRPIVTRQPNERLQALIQEAACSNAGLARRVNMCGAEHGVDLRYDKTSVARWLRGQQPRGQAPQMIAEALGRKLGRPVSLEEIGMSDGRHQSSAVGLTYAPTIGETIEQVIELWRSDVARREFLTEAAPVAAALVEPSRDWLISGFGGAAAGTVTEIPQRTGPRVGRMDATAVAAAGESLIRLDHRFGAGHLRPVVVHYLNSVVSGLLDGSYTEEVGRVLLESTARLCELAGYMAVDTGRPGLAQRYYIQALRLAEAAGARGFGGYVLAAGMSHLANSLGSPREAVQLARAAQEGTKGRAPARAVALFAAAEARAAAALGDGASCREAAARALAAME
ncbi:transcriptional regulator, partial [Streptomyces sp. A7024]